MPRALSSKPKYPNNQATPGFDYGEEGYKPERSNVGVNLANGLIQIEIKGLAEPKSPEAQRICREDLTELVQRRRNYARLK